MVTEHFIDKQRLKGSLVFQGFEGREKKGKDHPSPFHPPLLSPAPFPSKAIQNFHFQESTSWEDTGCLLLAVIPRADSPPSSRLDERNISVERWEPAPGETQPLAGRGSRGHGESKAKVGRREKLLL